MNTNKNIYKIDVIYTYIEPTIIYNDKGREFITYIWQDADVAIIKNNSIYTTNSIKITF
jgi:hypothetical protein